MSDDEATFYTSVGYGGDPYSYKLGPPEEVTGSLNDRFKSVRVGLRVKVLEPVDKGIRQPVDLVPVAGCRVRRPTVRSGVRRSRTSRDAGS